MALFKMPQRKQTDALYLINKARETSELKKRVKIKGTSLSARLEAIAKNVEESLGDLKDKYILLTTDQEWLDYCRNAVIDEYVAIDTETDSLDTQKANLVGVCIQSENQKPAYAPVGHISTITEQLMPNQVSLSAIKEGFNIIENSGVKQIYHNAYYDKCIIYNTVGVWLTVADDTLIMANLLNENESHSLKDLYVKYVLENSAESHKFNELFEGIPFCYIPPHVAYLYGAYDAKQTLELHRFFKPYLTVGTEECSECSLEKVSKLYEEVELPLINVLCKMKIRGISFDFEKAEELKVKYTKLKDDAEERFNTAVSAYSAQIVKRSQTYADIEYPVNYNSPSQLKVLFYDIIKTGVIFKKEPTGTGKHVLDVILSEKKYRDTQLYNIVTALSDVKKYDKLINSFIVKLSDDARIHNGKIHANFNQCGTNTMRLSSSQPNLQQCPSKNDDIRNMFIAGENRVLINLDFSQQEMMAVASLADDDKMLESFHKGRDIYSHIASIAFNVPYEDCLEFRLDGTTNYEGKERRKKSKAIALGIVYGKGVGAIAEDLHVDRDKAQEIKDSILLAFPKLKKYLEDVVDFCRENGFVENFYGGRRRLPDIDLPEYEFEFSMLVAENAKEVYKNMYLQRLNSCKNLSDKNRIIYEAQNNGVTIKQNGGFIAQAIRNAYNSPVQSTAAYITKMAMNNIDSNKELERLGAYLVLTIHDEVSISAPYDNAYEIFNIAKREFLGAGKGLKAELRCDADISTCWSGESLKFDDNNKLVKKE